MLSTRFRPLRLGATAITAGGLIVLAGAGTASAHVSIAEQEVAAGSTALITFQFSHGCDGSPTTEVRIQMPAEIAQVSPTINANWDVTKTDGGARHAARGQPRRADHRAGRRGRVHRQDAGAGRVP